MSENILAPLERIGQKILEIDDLSQRLELIDSKDVQLRKLAELINNLTVSWCFPDRVKEDE